MAMSPRTGFLFIVIGFSVAVLGAGLATVCTPSPSGFCLPTPFSGVGGAAAIMGGGLFLAGLILVISQETTSRRGPLPSPSATPTVVCQVCGKPLAWIPTASRWFCSKCDEYR
jgi:hypothetical protein